jgi:hypothetical protein
MGTQVAAIDEPMVENVPVENISSAEDIILVEEDESVADVGLIKTIGANSDRGIEPEIGERAANPMEQVADSGEAVVVEKLAIETRIEVC